MLTREDLEEIRKTLDDCEIQGIKIFGPDGNAVAKAVIKDFFEKRVASENLDFLNALNKVVNDPSVDLRKELEEIYKAHIAKSGESWVNLEGATFKILDEHFKKDHQKFIFGAAVTKLNKDEFAAALLGAVKTIAQLINRNITKEYIEQQIAKIDQQNKFRIFQSLDSLSDPSDLKNKEAVCEYAKQVGQAIDRIYVHQDRQNIRDLIQKEVSEGMILTQEKFEKLSSVMQVFEMHDMPQDSAHEQVNFRVGLLLMEMEEALRLEKENKELREMVSAAKQEIKKYPYVGIEQHSRTFSLPSLGEYVRDKSEQVTRMAVINNYEAWKKFVKKDQSITVSTEKYLDNKNLTGFDLAYKEYTQSLNQAKNPSLSSAARTMSGDDSIKAACDWVSLVNLKKVIKELDKWLALQSKTEPNINLKKSELFKNLLGFKEEILKDYASKMERFVELYHRSPELKAGKMTHLFIQASFFQSFDESSDDERLSRNKKSPAVSNTAETSPDSDHVSSQEEEEWWNKTPDRHRKLTK